MTEQKPSSSASQTMNTASTATTASKRRRNRKKKNKNKKTESQKEAERQKELEFSKMNNHGKLRKDLMAQGFSAAQIDTAMDEMWDQNMPYDEYEQVYKYLKEGRKKPESSNGVSTPTRPKPTVQKITENNDNDVDETKEGEKDVPKSFAPLTPSQVVVSNKSTPTPTPTKTTSSPKRANLNSMAARLDMVAGFDDLADAIFAMTKWIIQAAKPKDVSTERKTD